MKRACEAARRLDVFGPAEAGPYVRTRMRQRRLGEIFRILVGATGFEPATPCAQGRPSSDRKGLISERIAAIGFSWDQIWDHPAGDIGEFVAIAGDDDGTMMSSGTSEDGAGTMTHEQLLQRIVADPAVCHGKPCIRGHRVWVSLIIDLLADGLTVDDVLKQYPGLEADDIRACMAYAAEMTRERIVVTGRGVA